MDASLQTARLIDHIHIQTRARAKPESRGGEEIIHHRVELVALQPAAHVTPAGVMSAFPLL